MKVRIEIDTQTFVRFWLVVIGFIFAIFAMYLARTALIIIGLSVFLALALSAPVGILARRIPGRSRVLATALSFIAIVAMLGVFIFYVVPPITQQTVKLIEQTPAMIEGLSSQWSGVGELIERYNLQSDVDNAIASMRESVSQWASNAGKAIVTGIGSVFATLAATFLVLVLTFLMLVEGPKWVDRLWKVYQDNDKMKLHKNLAERMHKVVSGYVVGQLSVAGIGAIISGLAVYVMSLMFEGVPANLALPTVAITFLFALIPMFGSTIAGILVSLLLIVNSVPAALIFAVFFILYQQIENNFISPAIQAKYLDLSPLAVLVSITVGLYLFGLLGGIISIPIAGCIKVLIEEYFAHTRRVRKHNDKPIAKLVKKIQAES
jgi:predicted PurR-regulated permease PerM